MNTSLFSTVVAGTAYYVRAVNAVNAKVRFYKSIGYYPATVCRADTNYIPDNKNRDKAYDTWTREAEIINRKAYYPAIADKPKFDNTALLALLS